MAEHGETVEIPEHRDSPYLEAIRQGRDRPKTITGRYEEK